MEDRLQNKEIEAQQVEMTEEDLMKLLAGGDSTQQQTEFIFQPVEFDDEQLNEIVNTKEFIEGSAIGARLAGIYCTMTNLGVDVRTVSDLLINLQTLEKNQELQKVVNEGYRYQSQVGKQQQL